MDGKSQTYPWRFFDWKTWRRLLPHLTHRSWLHYKGTQADQCIYRHCHTVQSVVLRHLAYTNNSPFNYWALDWLFTHLLIRRKYVSHSHTVGSHMHTSRYMYMSELPYSGYFAWKSMILKWSQLLIITGEWCMASGQLSVNNNTIKDIKDQI